MKILLVYLVLLLFRVTACAESPAVGRYQLVPAKFDVFEQMDATNAEYMKKSGFQLKLVNGTINTVFKIDTATGEVWFLQKALVEAKDGPSPTQIWVPIKKGATD